MKTGFYTKALIGATSALALAFSATAQEKMSEHETAKSRNAEILNEVPEPPAAEHAVGHSSMADTGHDKTTSVRISFANEEETAKKEGIVLESVKTGMETPDTTGATDTGDAPIVKIHDIKESSGNSTHDPDLGDTMVMAHDRDKSAERPYLENTTGKVAAGGDVDVDLDTEVEGDEVKTHAEASSRKRVKPRPRNIYQRRNVAPPASSSVESADAEAEVSLEESNTHERSTSLLSAADASAAVETDIEVDTDEPVSAHARGTSERPRPQPRQQRR